MLRHPRRPSANNGRIWTRRYDDGHAYTHDDNKGGQHDDADADGYDSGSQHDGGSGDDTERTTEVTHQPTPTIFTSTYDDGGSTPRGRPCQRHTNVMSTPGGAKVNSSTGGRDEGKYGHGKDAHAERGRVGRGHANREHGHAEREYGRDEHTHGRGSSTSAGALK
ncbi:hypothetical protein BJ912DRAFT_1141027 [Pholiota molesta]|nr:hypothetical protein BJ912DRAFT_1141027 [Pholiota molesta]